MINSHTILVDIPVGSGVHVKSAGTKGERYVYKYTKYYRNAEGKPRNKAVSIGKVDVGSGQMIPNNKYYEFYKVSPQMQGSSVWDFGFAYLVRKCAEDMGLFKCLNGAFGDKAMDILVVAAYIMCKGNAMDGIDDWLERTYFEGFTKSHNSQSVSRLFDSITENSMHDFFKSWAKVALSGGNVCYDVTSISSYSQTMVDVEYGYNRDKDKLPQFNLGVFVDEVSKLPIYYNRYNGSLTDKTNLSYVLENAKSVGIENIKFVVDGGFISKECIQNLEKYSQAFMIGISSSLNIADEMIKLHSLGINRYANKLEDYEIYATETMIKYYGVDGRLVLFFDPTNHAQLCNELSERIRLMAAELRKLKRFPNNTKLKRYSQYFTIIKHKTDNGFDFAVDNEKIDEIRSRKGFFLIFTTDKNATHNDILYHYRAKDVAEKLFDQMKIDMQANRIRTHNETTTNGKTFVTFIALAIRTFMAEILKKYLTDNSTSLKKVFNQLENITAISGFTKGRFTKALSKKQKDILAAFSAHDDILANVESCLR